MKKYQDSVALLKARAIALKDAGREPLGYMERSEQCDDIWCNLCYKFKSEKAPWNR